MSSFWRTLPFVLAGLIVGLAPVTSPDIPARVVDYVRPVFLPEPQQEVSLVAVGDIMLSRAVASKMLQHGFGYPFASTTALIQNADIAFGNLETSITEGPDVLPYEMRFRADYESAAALRDAGFDVLSIANNHIADFGEKGIQDTVRALDEEGLAHVGAGRNADEAQRPAYIETDGIRFAFLAYTYTALEASANASGASFLRIQRMQEAVRDAKNSADVVIVSMHAGDEYVPFPNNQQTTFARAAIDAGAEMVIGHHPHVVQTMEIYRGKRIFYSLGNFIFDQMWSRETREGLLIEAVFTKEGVKDIVFLPVLIEDYAQPRLVEKGEDFDAIVGRLSAVPGTVDREE
jgi:poly-gamma-glutamate capsule biosynthesis protein CapA/YwtB (metallophosphatase superfamily)